jgi:hypothetical protein
MHIMNIISSELLQMIMQSIIDSKIEMVIPIIKDFINKRTCKKH